MSKIRGAANGKTDRAAGAKVRRKGIGEPCPECRRKRRVRGEKITPKTSIQEGKKGIRGLMIVFRKIRAVTGFSGET